MIKKTLIRFNHVLFAALLVLGLGLIGPAMPAARPAQAAAPLYELTPWVVAGGGDRLESGIYSLEATAGQVEAGQLLVAGAYTFSGGFWPAAWPIWLDYLPLVQK